MIRRITLCATLTVAWSLPQLATRPAVAQDGAADCASALWLEPLSAPEETGGTAVAEITEPVPDWLKAELVDACSGEMFALADFAGKTIYVEAMATWCPPCRDQLARVKEAAAQIPEAEQEDIVFVALSSEVDLPPEALAQYAADNEFPFVFAVMPAEMLRSMAGDLGQEVAVPPATPHFVVAPDGTIGEVRTGSETPEDLLALLEEARKAES